MLGDTAATKADLMSHDFDEQIDRRSSGCLKWTEYDSDVIPLWVADMDFRSPEPVIEALRGRAEHGIYGYEWTRRDLKELVCARLWKLYRWQVKPEEVVFLPGLVCGLNVVCRATGSPGDAVVTFTPVYPPFLAAPENQERVLQAVELKLDATDKILSYKIDFDLVERTLTDTTRLLLLCHPHNPIGRSFTRNELVKLGEICAERDMILCSDEIHCDLNLSDDEHLPVACTSPAIADRCITLMSPSKTYNISGLGASYAIVQNERLRAQVKKAAAGIVPEVNTFAIHAFRAAYKEGEGWLAEVLDYLKANRDLVVEYVSNNLPGVRTTFPEATYLSWLDTRNSGLTGNPHEYFLRESRVALNDGSVFGRGGEGFVRLNFGCPRALLLEALERMGTALNRSRSVR
jgi:cystathionine beta-lyase